jgi:hypothetical protein
MILRSSAVCTNHSAYLTVNVFGASFAEWFPMYLRATPLAMWKCHAKLNQDELVSSVGIAGTSEVGRIIAKAFRL